MNILHVIELTRRYRLATAGDAGRRRKKERLSCSARELLAEAKQLDLDLDDVIDALRRTSARQTQSHQ